jgi:hypothetical protein
MKSGRMVVDGKPVDVLNQYQKIIMEQEEACSESTAPIFLVADLPAPLRYTYRHGDGNAEIIMPGD